MDSAPAPAWNSRLVLGVGGQRGDADHRVRLVQHLRRLGTTSGTDQGRRRCCRRRRRSGARTRTADPAGRPAGRRSRTSRGCTPAPGRPGWSGSAEYGWSAGKSPFMKCCSSSSWSAKSSEPCAGHPPAQRVRGQLVAARRPAEAQVDPAGVQRGQRAELFGDHHRRVVGQHHAARSEPDAAWCSRRGGPAALPVPTTPRRACRDVRPPRTGGNPALRRGPRAGGGGQRLAHRAADTHAGQVQHRQRAVAAGLLLLCRRADPLLSIVLSSPVASSRQTIIGPTGLRRGLFPRCRCRAQ